MKKEIDIFWRENCDRRYMKSIIYPAIGTFLKNNGTRRVLDIGAEWYNVNDRDLFCNDDVVYWVIDINKKPKYLKCNYFRKVSILDLPSIYPNLINYFDVVISYGVLGALKFDYKSVLRYLENIFKILKPNGVFLLKLDTSTMKEFEKEYQIDFDLINEFFVPFSLADIPEEKVVSDKQVEYTFYTYRKRTDNSQNPF